MARTAEPAGPTVVSPRFFKAGRDQRDLFRPAPAFIPVSKPVLRDRVPTGPKWQFEIKHDGYRIQAHRSGDEVRLFSKSGRDYTTRLPAIATAMADLGVDCILEGEAVMLGSEAVTDFFALHAAVAAGHAPEAVYFAFDLLRLDGEDLRPLPLFERQARLEAVLPPGPSSLMMVEHLAEKGAEMHRHACAMGLEGIVAKRRDRPYRSGPCEDWIKVKCTRVEQFAVIGFDPAGRRGVASLHLARLDERGQLRACGSVGSGIGEASSRALIEALDERQPVVIDVEFRGWTPAGELRHPVFKAWHAG